MKEAELFTSTIAPESPGKCASTKRLAGPAPAPGLAGVLQAPQVQAPSPLTTPPPVPGTRPGNCRWRGRVGVCYLGWVSSLQPPCLPVPSCVCRAGGAGGAQASQHVTATRVKGLGSQESSPQHVQMGSPPPPLGCASSAHEWLWKVPEARYWTPLRYTPHAGYRDSPSQHGPELGFGKCFEDELSSGVRLC